MVYGLLIRAGFEFSESVYVPLNIGDGMTFKYVCYRTPDALIGLVFSD